MGRHYVFMLILEFLYLSENFNIFGRLTKSALRLRVCLSTDETILHSKFTDQFSIIMHIWIKQIMEHSVMKRKF